MKRTYESESAADDMSVRTDRKWARWSSEEDELLRKLVQEHGGMLSRPMVDAFQRVFPERSLVGIRCRWDTHLRNKHDPSTQLSTEEDESATAYVPVRTEKGLIRWTGEEDDLLRKLVKEHDGVISIPMVGAFRKVFPERSPDGIRHRWEQCLNSNKNTKWSAEEEDLLTILVARHGVDSWPNIIADFGKRFSGKTTRSIRAYWCNHININRDWTDAEDALLIEAQKANGNRWAKIVTLFPNRDDPGIRLRFKKLQAKESDALEKMQSPNLSADGWSGWTPAERAVIMQGIAERWTISQIKELIPTRTFSACRNYLHKMRTECKRTSKDAEIAAEFTAEMHNVMERHQDEKPDGACSSTGLISGETARDMEDKSLWAPHSKSPVIEEEGLDGAPKASPGIIHGMDSVPDVDGCSSPLPMPDPDISIQAFDMALHAVVADSMQDTEWIPSNFDIFPEAGGDSSAVNVVPHPPALVLPVSESMQDILADAESVLSHVDLFPGAGSFQVLSDPLYDPYEEDGLIGPG